MTPANCRFELEGRCSIQLSYGRNRQNLSDAAAPAQAPAIVPFWMLAFILKPSLPPLLGGRTHPPVHSRINWRFFTSAPSQIPPKTVPPPSQVVSSPS